MTDIVLLDYREEDVGKTIGSSKKRYTWKLMLSNREQEIVFTNTKFTGKKRIRVNGFLQHEQQVFQSSRFFYSWPLGNHLLCVSPNKDYKAQLDSAFILSIDGIPFFEYLGTREIRGLAMLIGLLGQAQRQRAMQQQQMRNAPSPDEFDPNAYENSPEVQEELYRSFQQQRNSNQQAAYSNQPTTGTTAFHAAAQQNHAASAAPPPAPPYYASNSNQGSMPPQQQQGQERQAGSSSPQRSPHAYSYTNNTPFAIMDIGRKKTPEPPPDPLLPLENGSAVSYHNQQLALVEPKPYSPKTLALTNGPAAALLPAGAPQLGTTTSARPLVVAQSSLVRSKEENNNSSSEQNQTSSSADEDQQHLRAGGKKPLPLEGSTKMNVTVNSTAGSLLSTTATAGGVNRIVQRPVSEEKSLFDRGRNNVQQQQQAAKSSSSGEETSSSASESGSSEQQDPFSASSSSRGPPAAGGPPGGRGKNHSNGPAQLQQRGQHFASPNINHSLGPQMMRAGPGTTGGPPSHGYNSNQQAQQMSTSYNSPQQMSRPPPAVVQQQYGNTAQYSYPPNQPSPVVNYNMNNATTQRQSPTMGNAYAVPIGGNNSSIQSPPHQPGGTGSYMPQTPPNRQAVPMMGGVPGGASLPQYAGPQPGQQLISSGGMYNYPGPQQQQQGQPNPNLSPAMGGATGNPNYPNVAQMNPNLRQPYNPYQ
ncbi:unnamed protein product [Amoebophrya sp. A120]|nr:unnamed protein product [Amoebophrya sp. A120]|eukprot:GSA120T00009219001.1